MSDITDLEQRITTALGRIEAAVENAQAASDVQEPDTSELSRLQESLDAEKGANAQLEERVRAIKEKQDEGFAKLKSRLEQLGERAEKKESELQRMKLVNAELRSSNQALRAANETGLGDSHLINKAMMAELEALRATQSADRSELDAIIDDLRPIVEESA